MSNNYSLAHFVSTLPDCNADEHPLRVSNFDDVFYALFILSCVHTGITTLTLLGVLCRSAFPKARTRRVDFEHGEQIKIRSDEMTEIIIESDNKFNYCCYSIYKFFNYLILIAALISAVWTIAIYQLDRTDETFSRYTI